MVHYCHLGAHVDHTEEYAGALKLAIILEDPEYDSTIQPEDLPLRHYGSRPPFRHAFFTGARRWVKRFLVRDDRIQVWLVPGQPLRGCSQ